MWASGHQTQAPAYQRDVSTLLSNVGVLFARTAVSKQICFFNTFFKNKHWIVLFILFIYCVLFIYCCSFNSRLETDCGRNIHMASVLGNDFA